MADVMAIISKAVFEKAAGKAPKLGARLAMDRYVSANKNLAPVGAGGRLYLVTVRPPNEALWLVAVLDHPKFDGNQWISAACDTPMTDVSALRDAFVFESGKGITAAAGALGMSLQTPRVLTAEDAALLDGALGGAAPAAPAAAPSTGNQDQRARLLAAVIADPDSAIARQVYADELATHNDPRGELIHVEMALAGPLSIRKRDALKLRRDALVKAHAAKWWPFKAKYRTHAGFVEAVTGTLNQLVPQLFASEPIVEVTVTGVDDAKVAAKLAKATWLPQIRRLIVRGSIGNDGFAALVDAKGLAGVQSLNVIANSIDGDGLENLTDLPACHTLVLTSNPIGNDGISALCSWKHVGAIETLYLSSCGITDAGIAELVARPLPKLEKLCLSKNRLSDRGAANIAQRAANLPALRFLELKGTGVGIETVKALAKALPDLRIDVRLNGLEPNDVAAWPRVRAAIR